MHRIILIFTLVLGGWGSVSGQAKAPAAIEVHVAGMVCAFCIQGIEKTLLALKDVDSIEIDLKTKVVTVMPKQEGALTDAHIKKAIDDAGYEVSKIVRSAPILSTDQVNTPDQVDTPDRVSTPAAPKPQTLPTDKPAATK
jgi:copper chaperone CopZ